jgi:hypothetical protein
VHQSSAEDFLAELRFEMVQAILRALPLHFSFAWNLVSSAAASASFSAAMASFAVFAFSASAERSYAC